MNELSSVQNSGFLRFVSGTKESVLGLFEMSKDVIRTAGSRAWLPPLIQFSSTSLLLFSAFSPGSSCHGVELGWVASCGFSGLSCSVGTSDIF
jgi:hypothetical protein